MLDRVATTAAFIFGFTLLSLLWKLRREFLLDKYRESMFTIREELFLYAAGNGLLNDVAYTELREIMNGLIRFGHKISLFHLLSRMFAARVTGYNVPTPAQYTRWETAVAALPALHSTKLRGIHVAEMITVMNYIARRSVVLYPILFLRKAMAKSRPNDQSLIHAVGRKNMKILESEALCYTG